jgi:hypothetical protein
MKTPKPIQMMVEMSNVKQKPRKITVDVIKSTSKSQQIAVRVGKVHRPWP